MKFTVILVAKHSSETLSIRKNLNKGAKMKFTVILVAKHSSETHTIDVDANDEEQAMEKVNTI